MVIQLFANMLLVDYSGYGSIGMVIICTKIGGLKIKPFMPTVFGECKVTQFTTHSYPPLQGFYILIIVIILSIASNILKKKKSKKYK